MSTALSRTGRAQSRGGRAVVSACPTCCGGCASWFRLAKCNPDPTGACGVFVPQSLYVCTTVRCTSGEQLGVATTVLIEGTCWVVAETVTTLPDGVVPLDPLLPLQCLPHTGVDPCAAIGCPTGPLWFPAYPCAGGPTRWICGYSRCEIRGLRNSAVPCVLIDPSGGGIPFARIPVSERANIITLAEYPDVFASCCDCAVGCYRSPVADPANQPCPDGFRGGCCCTQTADGTYGMRLRVDFMRTFQSLVTPGSGPALNGQVDARFTAEHIDGNGCASYDAVAVRDGFGEGHQVYNSTHPVFLGCGGCGFFSFRAPRLTSFQRDQGPLEFLVGNEGSEWGYACENLDLGNGRFLTSRFSTTRTCTQQFQTATYTLTTPASTETTLFEWRARLIHWGNDRDYCSGSCDGRIKRGAVTPDPNAGGAPPLNPLDFRTLFRR